MARPEGVGRAISIYAIRIEGREEWLAAILGIRPSTANRNLADLRGRSRHEDAIRRDPAKFAHRRTTGRTRSAG